MAMIQKLLKYEPRNFTQLIRCLGYFMLSIILVIFTSSKSNVSYFNLILSPIVFIYLYFEPYFLQKVEYHYGKELRKNVIYLIDVAWATLFVTAIHLMLFPTFIIAGGLFFAATFSQIHVFVRIISPLLAIAVFYLSSVFLFGFHVDIQYIDRRLSLISILLFMLFIAAWIYYYSYKSEELVKENQMYVEERNRYLKLNNQLARYAPLQIYQMIMRGELEAKVNYQRRKLTVFFSDIAGFTDLSEKLIPDDLAFLLNDYLRHMTEVAKYYGGTIDKFMGDGILIFFGDPSSKGVKEDAVACLEMAIAMRQQMRILRERWIKMGYESLHIRMGVATGYCHVGNYGTAHRMSYTIVGRDANLAARLQAAAEIDEILISKETFKLVKDQFLYIYNKPLQLKGISESIDSWQVVERYQENIDHYQRWYDYEYKGFNLILNLDKTPIYEYPQLIQTLEKTIDRLKLQQQKTHEGIVLLHEDAIIKIKKAKADKNINSNQTVVITPKQEKDSNQNED